jgi:hypothetical protein
MIVVGEERGQCALGLADSVEVNDLPQLAPQR